MSNYVRYSNADIDGYIRCVTCNVPKPVKEMHAGHFLHSSKANFVSYDERNIHPQCPGCNTYRGGNLIEYTLYMQDKYGPEIVEELKRLKQSPPMKRADFEEVIERLQKEIEE